MSKILIIDDDIASCRTLELHFLTQEFEVRSAYDAEGGLDAAKSMLPDLIILDIRMPGRSGLDSLPEFRNSFPGAAVIMITAYHDMESTIKAMQLGASEYIHKPIDIDEIDEAVNNALNRSVATRDDLKIVTTSASDTCTMVGKSRAMKEVFKMIGRIATQPVTVLITGESGTGKEMVARAIHSASDRSAEQFVAINCAALVDTLLESDMFGHEKGAFTGAANRQIGKFELANNGTIFLDEVGELSQPTQAKLLRVLQEKEYTPVGATLTKTTNARVIAATNADLEAKVKEGSFRKDLFYRLRVVTVDIPPLRQRKEDIMPLVQLLLGRINKELKRNITRLSQETMNLILWYAWPGNIRELNNILTKAVALCPGDIITPDLIPAELHQNFPSPVLNLDPPGSGTRNTHLLSLEEMEKLHVIQILQSTHGHKGKTCEILGVSRPRLRRMMKLYGISDTD